MALALSLTYLPALAEAPVATQPVDLTYAAEKTVNSVVYIKATINSRTQTVEYYNPFEEQCKQTKTHYILVHSSIEYFLHK